MRTLSNQQTPWLLCGAVSLALICLAGPSARSAMPADEPAKTGPTKMSNEELVAALEAADGNVRTAATAELFRRGQQTLPALKAAGAKQIAPVGGTVDGTRRRDLVYSLLEGLPPNPPNARAGYLREHFGIHVVTGTNVEDVKAMGKKYGFVVDTEFGPDNRPNCYVRVEAGKKLEDVLKRLLSEEPRVRTANLNYFER
jgi:hypothetical protein